MLNTKKENESVIANNPRTQSVVIKSDNNLFGVKNIDLVTLLGYVLSQVLGGVAAQLFNVLQQ